MKEKTKKWLKILIIILAILLVFIVGYIIYKNTIAETVDTTEQEDMIAEENIEDSKDSTICELGEECEEKVSENPEEIYTEFDGIVLSAQLPQGWKIIEYFDGDGTESLPEGQTYTGLTALDIVNTEDLQVFTLQAVSGIGFEGCPEYPLFDDNGESYMFEQESSTEEMGEELNIVDYTDTKYIEFEWLGVTFRRIGEKYFYDTQEGNNYFEPPCVDGLLTLEGLYFEDRDGYKYEGYFYGATEDSTEEDLVVVDQILESMELIR